MEGILVPRFTVAPPDLERPGPQYTCASMPEAWIAVGEWCAIFTQQRGTLYVASAHPLEWTAETRVYIHPRSAADPIASAVGVMRLERA